MLRNLLIVCLAVAAVVPSATARRVKVDLRDGLSIEKGDSEFYLGRYVGRDENCFPPINNFICAPLDVDEEIYALDRQLDIERFHIFIVASGSNVLPASIKDRLYLVAAELSVQRGYPMFTVLRNTDSSGCRTVSLDAKTHSTIVLDEGGRGTASGTTSISPTSVCGVAKSIDILLFRDVADLGEGLLERSFFPPSTTAFTHPVRELYYGTTPIPREDLSWYIDSSDGVTSITPTNAWKTYYDAAGLASDMRAKLTVVDSTLYDFVDRKREREQRQAVDPIERNRVTLK